MVVIEQSGRFSFRSAWVISEWCLEGSHRGCYEIQSEILISSASVSPKGKNKSTFGEEKKKSTFEEGKNETNFVYEPFRKTDKHNEIHHETILVHYRVIFFNPCYSSVVFH